MAGPILETKGMRLIFEKNSQKNVLKIGQNLKIF